MRWYVLVAIILAAALGLLSAFLIYRRCASAKCARSRETVSRKFVYELPIGLDGIGEVIDKLRVPGAGDPLRYEFDPAALHITFRACCSRAEYRLLFVPLDGRVYLQAEQVSPFTKGRTIYRITDFFREKLDAAPAEYDFYERLRKSQS